LLKPHLTISAAPTSNSNLETSNYPSHPAVSAARASPPAPVLSRK
jgi:hypothetical protein